MTSSTEGSSTSSELVEVEEVEDDLAIWPESDWVTSAMDVVRQGFDSSEFDY